MKEPEGREIKDKHFKDRKIISEKKYLKKNNIKITGTEYKS